MPTAATEPVPRVLYAVNGSAVDSAPRSSERSSASEQSGRGATPSLARELRGLSHHELLVYFQRLEAPPVQEMAGEYAAQLLDQGPVAVRVLANTLINAPGRWLCKAFTPVSPTEGRGYNSFRSPLGVSRRFRMRTFVGPSALDGRPSYFLDYSPRNRGLMATMVDEVRRAAPGLYLGIGRVGRTNSVRNHLLPFLLEGPTAPFAE